MKKGLYDISEIDTSQIYVEGSLSVRVKKLTSFVCVILPIAFLAVFLIVSINLKMYLKALITLVFLSLGIRQMAIMFLFALSPTPYIFIDKDGIVFKKKKYFWSEIVDLKFEKYLSVTWQEIMHIGLTNGEKISINLQPTFLNVETETIFAYINKYQI